MAKKNIENEEKVKLERRKLNKYFIFFLISTFGSIYLNGNSFIEAIFDFLSLISLLVLIGKVIMVEKKVKEIKSLHSGV